MGAHFFSSPVAVPVDKTDVFSAAVTEREPWEIFSLESQIVVDAAICHEDAKQTGVLITYLVPYDEQFASRETKDMWWGRDKEEILVACSSWVDMIENATKFKSVDAVCGLVDGKVFGVEGWAAVQIFVPAHQRSQVDVLVGLIEQMKGSLTRVPAG